MSEERGGEADASPDSALALEIARKVAERLCVFVCSEGGLRMAAALQDVEPQDRERLFMPGLGVLAHLVVEDHFAKYFPHGAGRALAKQELSTRAAWAIRSAEPKPLTVDDLAAFSEAEVLRVEGVGRKILEELRHILQRHGLAFRDDTIKRDY